MKLLTALLLSLGLLAGCQNTADQRAKQQEGAKFRDYCQKTQNLLNDPNCQMLVGGSHGL